MNIITVIVETPKGSTQKYNYEPQLKAFKLKKILPTGMAFPFDFGFIPGTKGGDGDPLDVMVISELTLFPGCYADCRIIGAIIAEQTEKGKPTYRNDRFLAVPEASQVFANVKSILDLPETIIKQLEEFFKNYNEQVGKQFNLLKRADANEAYGLIEEGK